MRIGIITFWNSNDNYGQQMQCYASQKYFNDNGHDAFLIKYLPQNIIIKSHFGEKIKKVFSISHILLYITSKCKPIHDNIINRFFLNHNKDRHFSSFRDKYIISTSQIYNSIDLKTNNIKCDALFCGSDQIWSGIGYDDIFFLNFGDKDIKRVALSVSFGRTLSSIEQNQINRMHLLLSRFNAITVREKEGLNICKAAGREDAKLLCDPTILNDSKIYNDIAEDNNISATSNGVFLYYLGHKTTISDKKIYKFIKKQKVQIFYTSSQGVVNLLPKTFPSVQEWLGCIKNAKFVVTNSFHGMVFSLLFNKQFIVIPLKNKGANTRIYTLLEEIGLSERICNSMESFEYTYKHLTIDYNIINAKMDIIKEKDRTLLNNILTQL